MSLKFSHEIKRISFNLKPQNRAWLKACIRHRENPTVTYSSTAHEMAGLLVI